MFNVLETDSLCDCIIRFIMLPLMAGSTEDPIVVDSSNTPEPNNRTKNEKKCTPAFCKKKKKQIKHRLKMITFRFIVTLFKPQ